ncbi:MAG: hypothetical protein ABSC38_01795 [Verrucomicrobiia bacterium]
MIEFLVGELYETRRHLQIAMMICGDEKYHKPPEETSTSKIVRQHFPDIPIETADVNELNEEGIQLTKKILQRVEDLCQVAEMSHSLQVIRDINLILDGKTATSVTDAILTQLHSLDASIVRELKQRKFAYIPTGKRAFFENSALLGAEVNEAFPAAVNDIREAGNSLAADLSSAAAFHLMRIVEIGLRELARKMKIKIQKTPLDYAGWKEVVKAIDTKLDARVPKARGPKQVKSLKFKTDILADFKSFEVTRNEIMHCRWRCNPKEAEGLFIRVRDFMQRLAPTISKRGKSDGRQSQSNSV